MPTSADHAHAQLKQRLVAGAYAPGAQLKEEPLARELGLSRTPVRAALKRLVAEGLATAEPDRGVRVSAWTLADIQETFELRALLEGHGAALAALRTGPALADQLEALNTEMATALRVNGPDLPERLQHINARFHGAIQDAHGSPRLRSMLAGLIDMPIVIRSYFISRPEDLWQSLHHHQDLAAAIRAGDADLARQAMQLHLRVAAQRYRLRRAEFGSGPGV